MRFTDKTTPTFVGIDQTVAWVAAGPTTRFSAALKIQCAEMIRAFQKQSLTLDMKQPCRTLGAWCANGCTSVRSNQGRYGDDYGDDYYDGGMDGSYGSYGSRGGGSYGSKSMY